MSTHRWITVPGKRLRILIGEAVEWQGHPAYRVIAKQAQQHGALAVLISRGIEGFGPRHHLETERFVEVSVNLPISIEILDTIEHIEQVLMPLAPILREHLVTLTPVELLLEETTGN
uniref:Uncharacterized protein n=1 Tax=Thermosporothrix sp. COM3 TaxID=2490863 RepID=A0A455SKY2_9CHLR|nr:hypothetical protein KTC_23130 [Thermosporothrix sp. COM3]